MLAKYCDKFNKGDKFFLVGYNNKGFDNDFLRNFFKQNGDNYFGSWFWADSIDVMVLAANYLKDERHKLENFQLRTVAKYLDIKVDETKLHDAMYDIYLTRAIYEIVKNGNKLEGEAPSRDSDLSERLATLNGEAMDKWHDAKTDPPEKTISYLCFMANGHMKVCFFTGAEWLDILQNTLEGVVTHWMARPPSPYATEAVETAIVEKAGEVIPLTETEAEAALRESGLLLETPIVK
jgi:DNA polymerase-3 subunit epsilon